jgi:cytochrome P450
LNGKRIPDGPTHAFDPDEDLLNWLREQFDQFGDIYRARIYGSDVYVISDPTYVEHVLLKNWRNYVKGRAIKRIALLLGKGLMVSEGDLWIRQRRMIQPAFHREVISSLGGVIGNCNLVLLAQWQMAARENRLVNVTRDLSRTVLEIVLRCIFGRDYEQAAAAFSILSQHPERTLAFADAFRPLAGLVIQLADKRRAGYATHKDILAVLMQARDRDSGRAMPDRQLASEIMTLIVAGHETTSSVLNWTWYLLSRYPEVERELALAVDEVLGDDLPQVDDLPNCGYARRIIEEAMRLYPPGWLMTRKALADDRLKDFFVPAGTEIYISPYLIHRHPRLWDEPDVFNPHRFDDDHARKRHPLSILPFSVGPRNCIGEFLARVEMQFHVMMVAKRLRLRYLGSEPPQLAAGVNLLSRHDFVMSVDYK